MKYRNLIIFSVFLLISFSLIVFGWIKFGRLDTKPARSQLSSSLNKTATTSLEVNIENTNINYDPTCQENNCDLLAVGGDSQNVGQGRSRQNIEIGDDPVLGSDDAPITMIEFSDFGCPFCKQFADQVFPYLKTNYIDTGRVKFVYKDVPVVQSHPNAQRAAEAANCANEQGKFWEYHDWIFANQGNWGISSQANDLFIQAASVLGLDIPSFNQCLSTGKYTNEVNQDFAEAVRYGVSATPTFFINGAKYSGVLSPAELDSIFR